MKILTSVSMHIHTCMLYILLEKMNKLSLKYVLFVFSFCIYLYNNGYQYISITINLLRFGFFLSPDSLSGPVPMAWHHSASIVCSHLLTKYSANLCQIKYAAPVGKRVEKLKNFMRTPPPQS